jgi:hypothetical protein
VCTEKTPPKKELLLIWLIVSIADYCKNNVSIFFKEVLAGFLEVILKHLWIKW